MLIVNIVKQLKCFGIWSAWKLLLLYLFTTVVVALRFTIKEQVTLALVEVVDNLPINNPSHLNFMNNLESISENK